jgi:hypothetical protein
MTYCENCGFFLGDFQDNCDHCGREKDRSYEFVETQMFWFYPIMSAEDSPRYSARNGRRLKDANTAFYLSALVPGLGQAYDDRRIRGSFVLFTFLALVAANLLAFTNSGIVLMEVKVILILSLLAFWIVQLIDAVMVTTDKNGEISKLPEGH